MKPDPQPPLLLIRESVAFSLEHAPASAWSATPQAFAEGCFANSFCLDEAGNAWRIVDARLKNQPTRLNRWMPWRRVPVEVTLSALPQLSVDEVLAHLVAILKTGNDFCESLGSQRSLGELERQLTGCTTMSEVFQLMG